MVQYQWLNLLVSKVADVALGMVIEWIINQGLHAAIEKID